MEVTDTRKQFAGRPAEADNFVDVLRYRARLQPDDVACTIVHEDDTQISSTYSELDRRARSVAAFLRQRVSPGARVLLMYPNGIDFVATFFGCLYAETIAVPVYPPVADRIDRALQKLVGIVASAQPSFGFTTAEWCNGATVHASTLPWHSLSEIGLEQADTWREPSCKPETVAFLQYTSGSTGEPKGVIVCHGNLIHNDRLLGEWFDFTPSSQYVSWLPLHHDMGLIGSLLNAINGGIPIVLLDPVDFLKRPWRWLEVISACRATHTGAPNFAYELCVRKTTPGQRASLDLSSLKLAYNGAEPIRPETIDAFAAAFSACGFRKTAFWPCYGLAEATLCVSGGPAGRGPQSVSIADPDLQSSSAPAHSNFPTADRTWISCGPGAPDQCIVVVDPVSLTVLGDDRVGEIWVTGPSVCQGYWQLQALSRETFAAQLPNDKRRWLRTGDLGLLRHGELIITGRLKEILILRGRNFYPQDIERTVEREAAGVLRLGCCAAFPIDRGGQERLAIVAEVDRHYPFGPDQAETLVRRLRAAVASEHQIALHLLVLAPASSVPKTSSGKLQRRKCREQLLQGAITEISRWELTTDSSQEDLVKLPQMTMDKEPPFDFVSVSGALIRILARLTGLPQSQIDLNGPLSAFGVDSLKAVEILAELEVWSGRNIKGDGIDVDIPLRELAEIIVASGDDTDPARIRAVLIKAIERVSGNIGTPVADDIPLSSYGIDVSRASDIAAEVADRTGLRLPLELISPASSIRMIIAAFAAH